MTEEATQKKYENLNIEEVPGSEIELTGEIPTAVVELHRPEALKALTKELELPGFRKGHVPEDVALQHVGEASLLKEIAERAIGDAYPQIVQDNKLEVVGRPAVTITKLAPSNPIGFKIRTAVYPKVELPDYKKVAEKERKNFKNIEDIEVTDEDIENELKRLQQMMAPPASTEAMADKHDTTETDAAKEDEEKEKKEEKKPSPPELNDEFAKSLGGFEGLEDLKNKMREQLLQDKRLKEQEKQRLTLAEAVINESKLEAPEIFIEGELDQMVASFTDRVEKAGMELETYLKQADKTIEDLKKEWHTDAEKRAKLQIVFNEIANVEKISPDPERLKREIEHVKEHYPEAQEESIRIYMTTQLNNQKVFELLEGKDISTEESTQDHVHDENCAHGHDEEVKEEKDTEKESTSEEKK